MKVNVDTGCRWEKGIWLLDSWCDGTLFNLRQLFLQTGHGHRQVFQPLDTHFHMLCYLVVQRSLFLMRMSRLYSK